MNSKLENFLRRNCACADDIDRLEALGAETLADAWEKASPADLVWIVTRPGVMDAEQRRQFLVFVLESIEDKLTDPRSKNILDKLRANSPITKADKKAALAALATDASWAASWAAAEDAAAAARAAYAADADAADAACSAADASDAAADAAAAAADAARKAAREQQAQWIRTNFALSDLHIN